MSKFNIVEAWLDNVAYSHSKSVSTRDQYPRRLQLFCNFIDKTPEQIVAEYQDASEREFRRRYAQYVKAFIADLSKRDFASTTISGIITAVKSFFKYTDLPLAFVPVGANRVQHHNRDITKEEIIQILKVSSPRDRAFFCMMAQSGLRPDTLSKLKRKHIEPDFSQRHNLSCNVKVPENISKGSFGAYFSFIPEETINYLKAYFSIRRSVEPENWIFTQIGTDEQINTKSMSGIFSRIIEKLNNKGLMDVEQAGYGKPRNVRLYNLRKYFRKYAGQAGVEYVNFWMGHKTNYKAPHIPASDEHYFSREDIEAQRKIYEEQAMPNLRINTLTPPEREVEIVSLRESNKNVTKIMEQQAKEINHLSEQVKVLTQLVLSYAQGKPIGVTLMKREEIEKRGVPIVDVPKGREEEVKKLTEKLKKLRRDRESTP